MKRIAWWIAYAALGWTGLVKRPPSIMG